MNTIKGICYAVGPVLGGLCIFVLFWICPTQMLLGFFAVVVFVMVVGSLGLTVYFRWKEWQEMHSDGKAGNQ